MKKRRKGHQCMNCELLVQERFNFCPQCGQENTNNRVSLKELGKDLLDNFLSFDSRLARSILPFLFKPGELTTAFNNGSRLKYIHPVRFYVIMSVFFFFVFGKIAIFPPEAEDMNLSALNEEIRMNLRREITDEYYNSKTILDSLILDSLVDHRYEKAFGKLAVGADQDSLREIIDQEEAQNEKLKQQKDSLAIDSLFKLRSTEIEKKALKDKKKQIYGNKGGVKPKLFKRDSANKTLFWFPFILDSVHFDVKKAKHLAKFPRMSAERLLDSLDVKPLPIHVKVATQYIKFVRNDVGVFVQNAIGNVPLMMMFMLPFFAIFLKLLYVRSSKLYIEHLIFTFHLQTFVFFIFGLALSMILYNSEDENIALALSFAMFSLLFYAYFSFKRVYGQGFFKTNLKMIVLFWLYVFTISLFLFLEIMYSFFMY
ncbi:MAG: DUF3667 domain-containing protein [Bacteroidetes bacterium]|nr:MAG: DUF3667 domain-containing protein [Bacteroidota bacterium]